MIILFSKMAAPMAVSENYVLSFHNSLLRKEDVKLLDDGQWLNDQVIGFVLEYFEFNLFEMFSKEVTFVAPEVVQFIKLSEGAELSIFLEPLDLPSKGFVFLVINDKADSTAGGSHWSLLVFQRNCHKFRHFDSMGSSNSQIARSVANKVQSYLNAGTNCTFSDEDAPQQKNCYDCGVFVICTAEHLCQQFFHKSTVPLTTAITQQTVTNKRGELKELILELGAKETDSR